MNYSKFLNLKEDIEHLIISFFLARLLFYGRRQGGELAEFALLGLAPR